MSFSIPPIATSTLTAAQVWAAQVVNRWKQYVLNDKQIPVANTWYTLIDESDGVQLRRFDIASDDDEEANRDMEVRITVDGEVWTSGTLTVDWLTNTTISITINPASPFTLDPSDDSALGNSSTTLGFNNYGQGAAAGDRASSGYISGHDIKVEVRQTEAVGTNPYIVYLLVYALWEAV